MATIGRLHTIQDNHAIREAVISFTVTPQIVNPEKYRHLLDAGSPLSMRYHKFEPVKVQELKIDSGINATTVSSLKDAGFKLISFRNGSTADVIQGLTQARNGLFTFNTVAYEGWTRFIEDTLSSATIVAGLNDSYKACAFSLMYIDEFYFDGRGTYVPGELFNVTSRNLPQGIEDSDLVDYNFSLQRNHDSKTYFKNMSVKVMPTAGNTIIRITENLTFNISPIPFVQLLQNSMLRELLDFCHMENKETLRDILNPTIAKLINL